MGPFPYGDTITHHVAGSPTTDAYGNDVDAFTDKTLTGVAVFPGNSVENVAGMDVVLGDMALLLPPGVAVDASDEFTLADGFRYRVNGAPGRYSNPFTGLAVTQVMLRRRS